MQARHTRVAPGGRLVPLVAALLDTCSEAPLDISCEAGPGRGDRKRRTLLGVISRSSSLVSSSTVCTVCP
eukprot:182034-Pyramimonas_sp.AAC.1